METFEIQIDNIVYRVTDKEIGDYSVETDAGDLYVIRPTLDESGVIWSLVTGDASDDLVNALGELIEEQHM
jgi:hypothetical protein